MWLDLLAVFEMAPKSAAYSFVKRTRSYRRFPVFSVFVHHSFIICPSLTSTCETEVKFVPAAGIRNRDGACDILPVEFDVKRATDRLEATGTSSE